MRILCITSSFPREATDIAGLFVEEFCDALHEGGIDVDVVCWSDCGRASDSRATRVRYAPAHLERLFYAAGAPENLERYPLRILLALPAVLSMLLYVFTVARRYDMLIGHWLLPGGLVARIAGKCTKIPCLAIGHSGGVHILDRLPKRLGSPLACWITSGPTAVVSEHLRSKLNTLCNTRQVRVIPMGVRSTQTTDKCRTRDWIYMGRLVPIKGVDIAIRAFASAKLTCPGRLHILGDGPLRGELEKLADDLNAPVIFHGNLVGTAKWEALCSASFLLAPSRLLPGGREEGCPVGLLEGVLSGLIPIVGHMPAAHAVIAEPLHQIETSGDVERWKERIESLDARPDGDLRKMRVQGRSQASAFDWDSVGPHWVDFIGEILSNHGTGRRPSPE